MGDQNRKEPRRGSTKMAKRRSGRRGMTDHEAVKRRGDGKLKGAEGRNGKRRQQRPSKKQHAGNLKQWEKTCAPKGGAHPLPGPLREKGQAQVQHGTIGIEK